MLPRRTRVLVHAGFAVLAAAILADFLHAAFGLGPGWEAAMRGVVPAGVNVIAAAIVTARANIERERRGVWILLAAAFSSYAIAFVLWGCWLLHLKHPPDPSIADFFWMAMYPLLGVAVFKSARSYSPRAVSMKIWLDGGVAATAMIALSAAFIVPPLVDAAHRHHAAVATNLLYPIADMVIGVLLVALLSVRGWRVDRKWMLLIATFVLWLGADCIVSLQDIDGALTGDGAATLAYMAAFTCLAAAAWQPEVHPVGRSSTHWSSLVAPTVLTLAAPTILVYDHFTRISLAALVFTWIALLASILRISVTMRDALGFRDVQRAALTDDLTELPNRRMFLTKLRQQVGSVERNGGSLTTLMLDLDNFKALNDTLGHDAGDQLLRMIGPRLERAAHGRGTVARLGGDEFAILLEPGADDVVATTVAEAVLGAFNDPFRVHGLVLRLTASVGIAAFPDDAASAETLLKCADVAMYDAKRSRRGFEHYSSERDVYTPERLQLGGELAAALERGEIEVVFQPIADTASRRIIAAEALVRWRRRDGSLRPPSDFLEAAELAGLSRPLTRRVLGLALAELRDWRAAGHNVDVSVNATVADLVDLSFPDEIASMLTAHGLPADALAIEVTESSIVSDPARVGAVLERLRAAGVKIALDDFGTGYSSLTHVRDLAIDLVKIDRSFVTQMCDEPADAAIVYATIELAHRLNLRVVAEGVEDERTWRALHELESDRIQGFACARPVSREQFRALLDAAPAPHLAESQSVPTPASTASGGSIA